MENFSALLTKISTISGTQVLSPNPGVSLKLRPVGGGSDITLTDNGGVAVYKGTIPTGRYKIIINGEDKTNTYGEYVSFDGTISADAVVTGVLAVERIPDLPVTKIINLLAYIQDNAQFDASKIATGVLDILRIPDLPATKILNLLAYIQDNIQLNASKIVSGVLDILRIPDIDIAKVTGLIDALASKLALTGGTMTGNINMNTHKISMVQSPTDLNDAATKGYVDMTTVSILGDTMGGQLNMGGNAIKNLPAQDGTEPATDGASVALITGTNSYVHENFLRKTGNVEQVMNNFITFFNDVWFGTAINLKLPHSYKTPTEQTELTTKKYVDKAIIDYLNGNVTPYQQSHKTIRVIHDGVIEPNRVYPTLQEAITAVPEDVSETNQYLIQLDDNTDEFYQPADVIPYVHIAGNCATNKIKIIEGTYSVLERGKIILRNLIFVRESMLGGPSYFENIIFENCAFTGSYSSLEFTGCEFRGINTFDFVAIGHLYLVDCVGYPIITNKVPILVGVNPPYIYNNKIYNTKINGSLLVADDTTTTLFDADGVIKIQHKETADAGSDSIGFDETVGKLYYKDSGNNIHYFAFEV